MLVTVLDPLTKHLVKIQTPVTSYGQGTSGLPPTAPEVFHPCATPRDLLQPLDELRVERHYLRMTADAPRVQRRLAAILAADVVGFSALMGRDEEGTLTQVKALQQDVINPAVQQHH